MNEPVDGWQHIQTCGQLCARFPDRVRAWLDAIDLTRAGLEDVRAAFGKDDLDAACRALVAYVEASDKAPWLRNGEADAPSAGAEDVLRDTFTIQGVTGTVPRNADGGIDWYHRGPRNDHEFALLFNRHAFFGALLRSWRATGDERYVDAFDRIVRDWVLHNPPPGERTREPNWRPLEVGLRASGSWLEGLFGFLETKAFTPAGRMMMIGSLGDHAAYQMKHWGHANPNITLMELNGLGHVPMLFPEFKSAGDWLKTATDGMMEQLGKQVYPDGAQNELTVGYHEVARRNFEHFADSLARTGHEVPAPFRETLEAMWGYTASVLRPDGHIPMNNDSDRQPKRDVVPEAAEKYGHPEWAYIATNGETGQAPEGLPSRVFPWAGQLVSRSGWDAAAHWSFFDFGPWGASHQHNDKLHLSVSAYGRDILVDSGRFAYGGVIGQKFRRPYATHSLGHNVVLVDGKGQGPGPTVTDAPAPETEYGIYEHFDFARGSFDAFEDLEGTFTHHRTVVYVRGSFWLVSDRYLTDRPRNLTCLWHFHPSCAVEAHGPLVESVDAGKGNVRIDLMGDVPWSVSLAKGQEEPTLQGWYSETYNDVQESTCAVYNARIPAVAYTVWLITPSKGTGRASVSDVLDSGESGAVVDVEGTRVHLPYDDRPVEVTFSA